MYVNQYIQIIELNLFLFIFTISLLEEFQLIKDFKYACSQKPYLFRHPHFQFRRGIKALRISIPSLSTYLHGSSVKDKRKNSVCYEGKLSVP